VTIAHGFTVLVLRRSILTEKVARRGYHLSREYAVDPLEIVFAREVVRTHIAALPVGATPALAVDALKHRQSLFPVIDDRRQLHGVVTRRRLRDWVEASAEGEASPASDLIERQPVVAFDDEPLRVVVFRMAETGRTRLPVVSRRERTLIGIVALTDLLKARTDVLDAEQRRERVLGKRLKLPAWFGRHADI
jgi:CIC family chloride channel protein